MAGFNFDEVNQYVQESDNKINFLKLQDDGWYAKVRFMYGPGEIFRGETVHNISEDPMKPKYVPCLREAGQPLEACPLCSNGAKYAVQFFIPVYVISIVSNVRGIEHEEPVNQVMLFQRGSTFQGALRSVARQASERNVPIVNCVFNLVRNGKAKDVKTSYTVEFIGVDNVGLDQLPPKIEVLGSYILPNIDYNTMVEKYVNKTSTPADIKPRSGYAQSVGSLNNMANTQTTVNTQPRTLNANTFAGNTVVNGYNQAPASAPSINSNVPF